MGNIDDRHRNPNMNNKDHLVGQLTSKWYARKVCKFVQKIVSPKQRKSILGIIGVFYWDGVLVGVIQY